MSTRRIPLVLIGSVLSWAVLGFSGPAAMAQSIDPAMVQAGFTDSSAAGLTGTNRVAISAVVVSFQASAAATRQAGSGMLADKTSAQTVLALPDMDPELQDAIVAQAYQHLKAELSAAGFEVIPEAQVTASSGYQQIVKLAGLPNHAKFGNAIGDVTLVGPSGLAPYLPYSMEGSIFEQPKTYIGYLTRMGGNSSTPGGPSMTSIGTVWKLPGLEVQMAKELNAHVVKAFYVVTVGSATAQRSRSLISGNTMEHSGQGTAFAQAGLLADQTRIAFRSPNGNAKWQKVPVTRPAPAKDGDVVVRLAAPLSGSTDYFHLDGDSRQGGLFNPGADFQFKFTATLTDPAAYRAEVEGMIAAADSAMLALVRH